MQRFMGSYLWGFMLEQGEGPVKDSRIVDSSMVRSRGAPLVAEKTGALAGDGVGRWM